MFRPATAACSNRLAISGPMTDAGVKELARLKKLQTLVLHPNYDANNVTEAGLLALQKAAPSIEVRIATRPWGPVGKTLPRAQVGSP